MLKKLFLFVFMLVLIVGSVMAQDAPAFTNEDAIARRVEWLRGQVHPLATQDMCSGHDDILPFADIFDGIRLVGLGEATHGTKDFNLLRNRLVDYLVTERGFRYLIFEAEMGDIIIINRWLTTGEGSLEDAMTYLLSIYWYDDYVALFQWLREWNVAHPDDQVRLYGNDAQGWEGVLEALESDLAGNADAAPVLARIRAAGEGLNELQGFSFDTNEARLAYYAELDEEEITARTDALTTDLHADIDALRAYLPEGEDATTQFQRLLLRNLERFADTVDPVFQYYIYTDQMVKLYERLNELSTSGMRDEREIALGENAIAIAELEGETPGIYWAHNAHVGRGYYLPASIASGEMIARALGSSYLAVATDFYQGGFYAGDEAGDGFSSSREFIVDPLPRNSLSLYLNGTGHAQLWFSLRGRSADDPDEIWLFDPMRQLQFGGMYSSDPLGQLIMGNSVLQQNTLRYDAILFVQETRGALTAPQIMRRQMETALAAQPELAAQLGVDVETILASFADTLSPYEEVPTCLTADP
jgi:erythromycin esterase